MPDKPQTTNETDELKAKVAKLERTLARYKAFVRAQSRLARVAGTIAILVSFGPRLVTSIESLIRVCIDGKQRDAIPTHAAHVIAAVVRRGTFFAVLGFLIALVPPSIMLWQNIILAQQNKFLSEQITIERNIDARETQVRKERDELSKKQLEFLTQQNEMLTSQGKVQSDLLGAVRAQHDQERINTLHRVLLDGNPSDKEHGFVKIGNTAYSETIPNAPAYQRLEAFRTLYELGERVFTGALLQNVKFNEGSDEKPVLMQFNGITFRNASFLRADLRGVTFYDVDFRDADFGHAVFDDSRGQCSASIRSAL